MKIGQFLLVLVCVIVFSLVGGAVSAKIMIVGSNLEGITTKRINIVNDLGFSCISMNAIDNSPAIIMNSFGYDGSILMGVRQGITTLNMTNDVGEDRVNLTGGSTLSGAAGSGMSGLILVEDDNIRAGLMVSASGSHLSLSDESGMMKVLLGINDVDAVSQPGGAGLTIYNSNGGIFWQTP